MQTFSPYPKWKYHKAKEALVVENKEAELALGSEWVDSPAELAGVESDVELVAEAIEKIIETKLPRKRAKL